MISFPTGKGTVLRLSQKMPNCSPVSTHAAFRKKTTLIEVTYYTQQSFCSAAELRLSSHTALRDLLARGVLHRWNDTTAVLNKTAEVLDSLSKTPNILRLIFLPPFYSYTNCMERHLKGLFVSLVSILAKHTPSFKMPCTCSEQGFIPV